MIYYTFRLLSRTPYVIVECNKWNDCLHSLVDTYVVYPRQSSCNCMASVRECKHVLRAQAIIKPEFVNDMHHWIWSEKNGWEWVEDIPEMEEVLEALSSS